MPLEPMLLWLASIKVMVSGRAGSCEIWFSRITSSSSSGRPINALSSTDVIALAVKSILFSLSGRRWKKHNLKCWYQWPQWLSACHWFPALIFKQETYSWRRSRTCWSWWSCCSVHRSEWCLWEEVVHYPASSHHSRPNHQGTCTASKWAYLEHMGKKKETRRGREYNRK